MKYQVSGKFTVRMSGQATLRISRTVEADDESEAIDAAIEEEIDMKLDKLTEALDFEYEDTENLKAIPFPVLPIDIQMRELGLKIAPQLF